MTSVPSREDIKAELYQAGIRNPCTLSRVMTVIDVYALAVARRTAPIPDPGIKVDPYSWLSPGKSDTENRVTRCAKCINVKKWSLFGIDRSSPTEHKTTCKACLRTRPGTSPDERRWKCPSCEKKKEPEAFSEEKQKAPRIREKCLSCKNTSGE